MYNNNFKQKVKKKKKKKKVGPGKELNRHF